MKAHGLDHVRRCDLVKVVVAGLIFASVLTWRRGRLIRCVFVCCGPLHMAMPGVTWGSCQAAFVGFAFAATAVRPEWNHTSREQPYCGRGGQERCPH